MLEMQVTQDIIATVRLFDTVRSGPGSSTSNTAVRALVAAEGGSAGAPGSVVMKGIVHNDFRVLYWVRSSWLCIQL